MLRITQSASVKQLLVVTYFLVTVPAALFVAVFSQTLDKRIEFAQTRSDEGQAFGIARGDTGYWLVAMGSTIRSAGLPMTVSTKLKPSVSTNLAVAQSISDLRAALIYLAFMLFIFAAILVWLLANSINKPLEAISNSISRLAKGDLLDPVRINGPLNVQRLGQGLEKLRLRLAESENQQKSFLRHVSHEIKTPLTSIKEGSQLLDDEILGSINSEQREITTILNKSTKELQTSIENLLNYNSAISVDEIKKRQTVELSQVLNSVIEKHALGIRNKRLVLKKDIDIARAFVDEQQIATVFDNLLSNAIKFSNTDGQIKLWLRQDAKHTVFTIRDYGPGVSEKHRSGIFDAFYVGEQSSHTPLKGTGLGLSIARQYVEQHNGKIDLLNTRQGAAFQVTLKR